MEKFYENIEDYLNGNLSPEETNAFDKVIKEQPALQTEVNLYKEVSNSLAADFTHENKNKKTAQTLKKMSAAYFSNEKQTAKVVPMKKNSLFKILISAAAVALVLVLSWPYLFTEAPLQYADVVLHSKASFTEMGTSENTLAEAEKAFNTGDYAAAITPLENYLMTNDNSTEAWFYIGICKLETGEEDSAEMLFRQISTLDTPYRSEATWYLALTHLKKEEFKKCKAELEKIKEGSEHFEVAQQLMKQFKE